MEENTLMEVEIKNIHYLTIEAADLSAAFSIFKQKLEEKEVFISEFTNISELIEKKERYKDEITKDFIDSTKFILEPTVWGGLYAKSKGNTLIKQFVENNIVQAGTKKWETRYVLIGETTHKRYNTTQTTKGDAVELAKKLILGAAEDISIQVEKVLTSHDPTVSIIKYIKDPTEHGNIFLFLCNLVTFDEKGFNTLYTENTEMDPITKQFKIRVDTIFEYDRKIKI